MGAVRTLGFKPEGPLYRGSVYPEGAGVLCLGHPALEYGIDNLVSKGQ
jgi:hypothetical protein